MSDYTIVNIIEEPKLVNGKPASDLRVQFTVDGDGPFFERFDKATATDFTIKQKLGDFARMIRSSRG